MEQQPQANDELSPLLEGAAQRNGDPEGSQSSSRNGDAASRSKEVISHTRV